MLLTSNDDDDSRVSIIIGNVESWTAFKSSKCVMMWFVTCRTMLIAFIVMSGAGVGDGGGDGVAAPAAVVVGDTPVFIVGRFAGVVVVVVVDTSACIVVKVSYKIRVIKDKSSPLNVVLETVMLASAANTFSASDAVDTDRFAARSAIPWL